MNYIKSFRLFGLSKLRLLAIIYDRQKNSTIVRKRFDMGLFLQVVVAVLQQKIASVPRYLFCQSSNTVVAPLLQYHNL